MVLRWVPAGYIPEIISRIKTRLPISHSVAVVMKPGHAPRCDSRTVTAANGIMIPVRGRASRLVSRK